MNRVFTDSTRKESSVNSGNQQTRKQIRSHSPPLSLCSTTPTGSEMDEEDNRSDSGESSIDSWVNINVENDSANAILKIMSPQSCQTTSNNSNCDEKDKPYVCTISNCKKRYRNANGLKYHTKKAHNTTNTIAQKKELIGPAKVYKCQICGKNYKTSHGLKNHNNSHHNNNTNQQQTQTQTQTSTQAQTNSGTINKTVITSNCLSPASKESILATFVRMKSIPSQSGVQLNRNGMDPIPVMLTLQTDNENKLDSDSVSNDDNQGLNNDVIRKCPVIAAPTLQQHLLSPIVTKIL
jgi:hypothetical protein